MISIRLFFGVIIAALSMLSCGTAPNAGGATDSPNAIAGVVIDLESGKPVVDVQMFLLRDIERDTSKVELSDVGSVIPFDSTTTDSSGRYTFTTSHKGIFALLGKTSTHQKVVFIENIAVNEEDVTVAPASLTPAGAITGVVDLPEGPEHHAILVGTNYQAPIDANGKFTISGVPADTFLLWTVLTYPDGKIFNFATFDSVVVIPGKTVNLDTLRITTVTHTSDTMTISDCDGTPGNSQGGVWWRSVSDSSSYDKIPICVLGGRNGGKAATMAYSLGPNDNTATIGRNIGRAYRPVGHPSYGYKQVYNISAVRGLSFWIRAESGDSVTVRFHSALIPNWNDLVAQPIALSDQWRHVVIETEQDLAHLFDITVPRTWNDVSRAMDAIMFHVKHNTPGESGRVWVDDVKLLF